MDGKKRLIRITKAGKSRLIVDKADSERVDHEQGDCAEGMRLAAGYFNISILNQDLNMRYTSVCYLPPGLDDKTFLGKTDEDLFPHDAAIRLRQIKKRVLTTGVPASEVITWERNGERLVYNTRIQPRHDRHGKIIGLTSVSQDITQRARTEYILKEYTDFMSTLQHITSTGHWLLDASRHIVEGSDELFKIFGLSREEFNLKFFLDIVHPDFRDFVARTIEESISSGKGYDIEHPLTLRDGSTRYIRAIGLPVFDESARIKGLRGVVQDITELRLAYDALKSLGTSFAHLSGRPLFEAVSRHIGVTLGIDFVFIGKLSRTMDKVSVIGGYAKGEPMGDMTYSLADTPCDGVIGKGVCIYTRDVQTKFPKDADLVHLGVQAYVGSPIFNKEERPIGIMVALHSQTLYEPDKIVRYFTTFLDRVSAEMQLADAEASIRENEEFYTNVIEASMDGFTKLDNNACILDVNDKFCQMSGYSRSELQNMCIHDLDAVESREKVENHAMKVISQGSDSFETLHRRKDGSTYYVEVSTQFKEDHGGMLVSFYRDITKRKMMEEALRENEERFRSVAESANDAIIISDTSGLILSWSRGAENIFGFTREEAVGHEITLIIPERYQKKHEEGLKRVIEGGEHHVIGKTVELEGLRKDGSEIPVELSLSEWALESKKYYTGIIRDISARKKMDNEIRLLNVHLEQRVADRTAELEYANKELEAFAYSVSHDLRAPLRSIEGFSRILTEDYETLLDEEGKRLCRVISAGAVKMAALIEDLLRFSRVGRSEMHMSDIDMTHLADTLFNEMISSTDKPRIVFKCETMPHAYGDLSLIRQVWTNLLSNAIKFSSNKEKAVIEVQAEENDRDTVYSVRDNGAGFDMQYVDKLFSVFQRLHSSKDFEGTGAGLAIVQRIIHRHGGSVRAYGEPGKGATLFFSIPRNVKTVLSKENMSQGINSE